MNTTTKTKWERFEEFFNELEFGEFDGSSVLDYVFRARIRDNILC